MIRVSAVLVWIIVSLTSPAQACSANANSTFCADGWVARQPAGRVHADEQASAPEQGGDSIDDSGAPDAFSASGENIYVEGAVTIGDAPVPDEEPL